MPAAKYHITHKTRQRLQDLLDAQVPMSRIEKILGLSKTILMRQYPMLFDEEITQALKWEPTNEQVRQIEIMAGLGMKDSQIAMVLDVRLAALRASCADLIAKAPLGMDLKVGANLFRMATGDVKHKNTALAAVWWTKARMGWKDTSRVESTGADGGPVQSQVQILLPDNGRNDTPIIDATIEAES
jgi:hypothetical protein